MLKRSASSTHTFKVVSYKKNNLENSDGNKLCTKKWKNPYLNTNIRIIWNYCKEI